MGITQNGALKRDDNDQPVMGGTSSSDNATIINASFNPSTRRLLVDSGGSSGTVQTVAVASANGFAGTSNADAVNPILTLSTTITGVLKGDGTAISAASAATDYAALAFKTIAVSGQTDVVADSPVDTLTLVGSGITITTNAATDTITFTAGASGLTVGTTTIASGTTTRILYDNAGTLGEYTITGTGTVVAMANGPTFIAPVLGAATATSINGLTITASTGVLTITNAKTLSVSNSLTFAGTDGKTVTHSASTTFAGTDGKTLTISNSGTLSGGDAFVLAIAASKTLTVSNTLTFTGTDGNSFAFPSGSDTVVTLGATQTLAAKTLTAPKIVSGGFIADANGNEQIIFTTTASAVNELTLANAATGTSPTITSSGGDANVGLNILTKGTGVVSILGNSTQAGQLRIYEDTDDGSNFTAFKVGTQAADITYTLPTAVGGALTYLKDVAGNGVLSWATAGSTAIDYQAFTANGTWTKPSGLTGNELAVIMVWGGGGSGGARSGGIDGGGGGGGACVIGYVKLSQLGATETVTVGATATAGANSDGTQGNNSSFGSLFTAYGGGGGGGNNAQTNFGGGGGGGALSAGAVGANGPGNVAGGLGGRPQAGAVTVAAAGGDSAYGGGGGGGNSAGTGQTGGFSMYGGGGGGGATVGTGGKSVYGGGGGAGGNSGTAGTSQFGGAGGTSAGAGNAPGGGGGGGTGGGTGGNGARGECRVWVVNS